MLRKEDYAVIKALKKRGVYHSDIAAELGIHPKTVSRALKRDGPPTGKRRRRGSKLDPYKAQVDQLLADGKLDYSKVYVKIDSRQCDLFRAADLLRLRIMAGRHAEADCIARDMTDALAEEIAALLISGGM